MTTGSAPLVVRYTDLSPLTGINQWRWRFGDGTWYNTPSAALRHPTHVFAVPGSYDTQLTICSATGCNTTVPGTVITANLRTQPIVKFAASPRLGISPLTVRFADQSTGIPTDWRWSFGDGTWFNTTAFTLRNPTHVYTLPGTYPSKLIACNAAGCNATASNLSIIVR